MNKRTLDTIDTLNDRVKVKIAPSKVHGVGVFAIRKIAKGSKLYANAFPQGYKLNFADMRKLEPEVRELILSHWPRVTNGEQFLWPIANLQGYMNHDDKPNYDCDTDLTLRTIKVGEEITEDYRQIKGWEEAYTWLK